MSDIRKWFVKAHPKNSTEKPAGDVPSSTAPEKLQPDKPVNGGQESSARRKTSKYFADKQKPKDSAEKEIEELPVKRKAGKDNELLKTRPLKKLNIVEDDDDADFVPHSSKKSSVDVTPNKKLKSVSGRAVAQKAVNADKSDEDENKANESPLKPAGRGRGGRGASANPAGGRGRGVAQKTVNADESDEDESKATESPLKPAGRGRGGRGASANPAGGRGRGGGRGFMNFGERKDPPHKGEKEVPEGAPNCLENLTFVISGTLDSLEREEAEDLIKRHGGRVTGSVSKKTNYLLCDEDIGGRKSERAKELRTAFLTEDGLFDLIRASNRGKATTKEDSKKSVDKVVASLPKKSPQKVEIKKDISNSPGTSVAHKLSSSGASPAKRKDQNAKQSSLTWTEKYKPQSTSDIIGNQSLVKQLHDWLSHWNEQFLDSGKKGKGKKQSDSSAKKAVLLNGTPGIGKTTSAKLVSKMLGFQAIEVNASDSRGKADAKIEKGIGGSNANSVKELVSNESLSRGMDRTKQQKTVLIMDEVDGMSAGDRGGVADLISSIKASKVPIICICNDRYSQKLKSLVNYCLLLTFRKPTKQQMAKRLSQVARAEGLQVNEIALEELADRVNGDMRMALNQLQYMSLSMSVIKYDDIRQRLLSSAKDEDISPFTAVDKLFSFNGGKLRMDERVNLSMSDPDLVPLIVQENYINFRPSLAGKDDNGVKRMNLLARAAESIGDGDIINVQIRRYRQWQLSQTGTLASSIIPAALLHGSRETLEPGERNYNRFSGWLGKNSTMGKNFRLMEDLHVHFLASRESNSGRRTLRIEYLTLLQKRLTNPLKELPKEEAVQKVVEFMNTYSISQEDFDTIVELSKFKGHPNPLDGIAPAVKSALTKAYKEGSKLRMVRAADLVTIPGMKKAPKKRIAALLEPTDDGPGEANGDALAESEEENNSDAEEGTADGQKLQNLQSLNSKGIKVEMDLKGTGSSSGKKPAGRGRGGGSSKAAAAEKKGGGRGSGAGAGRGSGSAAKRKR